MKKNIQSSISIKTISLLTCTSIIFGSSCSFNTKAALAKEHVIKNNLIFLKNTSNIGSGNQLTQSIKQTENPLNTNSIADDFRYGIMFR